MTLFKRKVEVPTPEQTIELECVQLWRVDWKSSYDKYSFTYKNETEVFTSEEDAKIFEQSLNDANKLLRNTGPQTRVYMSKYNVENKS